MGQVNNEPVGFFIGITPKSFSDSSVKYRVQSINHRIPDEVILTIVRHWLKDAEDSYFKNFSQDLKDSS